MFAKRPMTEAVTRASFESQRQTAQRMRRRDMNVLAVVSVTLGVAQLALIRWTEATFPRDIELAIIVPAFLAYAALLGVLAARMERRHRAACPRCPACRQALRGMSERVASATGRCDGCGAQVIEDPTGRTT